ncbi:MAG: indole-3-glycerol phosphate synthase [Paraglaciecola sp.]|jgi:indole-3-glycerol phosphate synthase
MTILEKITNHKRTEVADRKSLYPTKLLEQSIYFNTPSVSLKKYLLRPDKSGIIAEFKRHSPSKGDINPYAKVEEVSIGYMQAGASALSILTDEKFFKGANKDLTAARKFNFCPILRKDFVVDEYQILEAKSIGADAILLIAECLEKEEVARFAKLAKSLGLEVLMEIHSQDQLAKISPDLDVIGVNNRNLKTFEVSTQTSIDLFEHIPSDFVRISESGISEPKTIAELKAVGFQGFLIGERFMATGNPGRACREFLEEVAQLG